MRTVIRGAFFVLALASQLSCDSGQPVTSSPVATTPVDSREALLAMATFLGQLDRFSVSLRGGYDVLQESGQKIQFIELRQVLVSRPGLFRSDETHSDGRTSSIFFDGAVMTVFDAETDLYSQVEQPGSVDDAILYFIRELQLRLPLAPVFSTRLAEELEHRLLSTDYVEASEVFDVPVHHVIGRTAVVDFQVWIAAGETPWPLRVVLTYRGEPGQPQYWADFSEWNAQSRISHSAFEFSPPADAHKIPFAVQVRTPVVAAGAEANDGGNP